MTRGGGLETDPKTGSSLPNLNGVPTSLQFKRCMARHGWRYQYTRQEPTWIDPETGLRCRNTGFATVCS
jgi:hypothetical protein